MNISKKTVVLVGLIFTFFTTSLLAQGISSPKPRFSDVNGNELNPNVTIALGCGLDNFQIEALYPNVGDTSEYTIESIPYRPQSSPRDSNGNGAIDGNELNVGFLLDNLADDRWSQEIHLESTGQALDFCFFGNPREYFRLSSNGAVSFNTAGNYPTPPGYDLYETGDYSDWTIHNMGKIAPNADMDDYRESIMTPFHDTHPTNGDARTDSYSYWDINDASGVYERFFVLGVHREPMYSCGDQFGMATHQMVFYETTNIIEFHIQDKPVCEGWAEGYAALGIQNKDLDLGYAPPGRDNLEHWQVLNLTDGFLDGNFDPNFPVEPSESWRLIPSGGTHRPVFTWYNENGDVVGNDPVLNIQPSDLTVPNGTPATYTAEVVYTNHCTGEEITSTQTITFQVDLDFNSEVVNANDVTEQVTDVFLCETPRSTFDLMANVENNVPNTTVTYSWIQFSDGTEVSTTDSYTVDSDLITNTTERYDLTVSLFDAAGTLLCTDTDSVNVTVSNSEFEYPNTDYCLTTDANPTSINVSPVGGVYSINNGGVVDPTTGEVDLVASGDGDDDTGVFTITYTVGTAPNTCESTFEITIQSGAPELDYDDEYCSTGDDFAPNSFSPDGGQFTIDAGVIDVNTGLVDVSELTVGTTYTVTYTVTGVCGGAATQSFTITDSVDATFTYPDTICLSDTTSLLPNSITTAGGNFAISLQDGTPGGTINQNTGDLAGNNAGTYKVTYTTVGCEETHEVTVTINPIEIPTFSFVNNVVCAGDGNVTPNLAANISNGNFTIDTGVIDADTGEITIDPTITATTIYNVTYTTIGNCPETLTLPLTVNPEDDASFTYQDAIVCITDANILPNAITTPGGTFSINNGGVIDTATGEINIVDSGEGQFVITYETNGACSNIETFDLTITSGDASFDYVNELCQADANPVATNIASTGGVFSVTPTATIDPNTGELDLTSTIEGTTYTITYAIAGTCPTNTTNTITIIAVPNISAPTTILTSCHNGNGTANYDVDQIEDEIVGSETGLILSYHPTSADAQNNQNEMSTNPHLVARGNVWVRAENGNGCFSIVEIPLQREECYLIVPEGFSPQSDRVDNQTFNIKGLKDRYPNFELYIYNRFGNEVYYGDASKENWNGKVDNDGEELPAGTYFYGLELNDDFKTHHKGWVYLQR